MAASSLKQITPSIEKKRAIRNAKERNRRSQLKGVFSELKSAIPFLDGEKVVSRALILKKAADFITYMKNKNESGWKDLELLKKKNSLLEARIARIERETDIIVNERGEVQDESGNNVIVLSDSSDSESKPKVKLEIKEELVDEFLDMSDSSDSEFEYCFDKNKRFKFSTILPYNQEETKSLRFNSLTIKDERNYEEAMAVDNNVKSRKETNKKAIKENQRRNQSDEGFMIKTGVTRGNKSLTTKNTEKTKIIPGSSGSALTKRCKSRITKPSEECIILSDSSDAEIIKKDIKNEESRDDVIVVSDSSDSDFSNIDIEQVLYHFRNNVPVMSEGIF